MKQVSIGRHILQLLIMALAAMALAMLVFVHILANAAVEYDIKQNLEREIYKNLKEVYVDEEGTVMCNVNFMQADEDISFVILNGNGKVLLGKYPDGCPQDIEIEVKKLHQTSAGGEVYYIRDVRKRNENGLPIFIRGIVRRSDAYSRYQTLEYLAFLSILLVSGIAIMGGIILSRQISGSLKGMCRFAEGIGQNMNMSGRMGLDGKFYELDVLVQANNRMLDRLEETFRQQEQFTSDVAHELRTPIAVMAAQCQYANGKTVSREDYQEAFEVIERQSAKVSAIISRLLELSRLDCDRRQIEEEDIDLPEIVQSVCEDLQQKSGDTLQFCLKLAQAHTVGDISLIAIASQNLLANAVKYSAPGSVVEAETGIRDDMVFLSVKDHGEGISEEDMAHIFKRFYKADKSRNSEGFGLGLPLAMKIAQKHGGTILAESEPGKGSIFTLLLPGISGAGGSAAPGMQ